MTFKEAGILLTVLLGAWNLVLTLRNSRRTTFINTVTAERVRWIQNMRESISSLCGALYSWLRIRNQIPTKEPELRGEIDKLRILAILQLNPSGSLDKELISLIGAIPEHFEKAEQMPQLLSAIVEKSQIMLKQEWDKVRVESEHGNQAK